MPDFCNIKVRRGGFPVDVDADFRTIGTDRLVKNADVCSLGAGCLDGLFRRIDRVGECGNGTFNLAFLFVYALRNLLVFFVNGFLERIKGNRGVAQKRVEGVKELRISRRG